ncbi:MAG: response regulator [Calditrichaeota bacterium]|nr:response regulator [Calditrichota bacterium]
MTPWKVLLIDDEKEICLDLEKHLRSLGYDVFVGHSLSDARTLIEQQKIDIAILDMVLPDGTGLQVYERLKHRFPHAYTIVITGNATLENTISALNYGVDAYLLKPFPVEALNAALLQATTHLNLREENQRLIEENQKTRRFYENLLNSSSEAIFVVNLDFLIQYCNSTAEEFLKTSFDELFNQNLQNYIIDGYKVLNHVYHQLMIGKPVGGYRVTLRVDNQQKLDVNLSADFLHENGSQTAGLIITLENTTFQNELFNQLLRKEKLASIANLANALAHEIRNPINILSGRIQLLKKDFTDRRYQKSFEIIQRQIDRISYIVTQLLKFNVNWDDTIPEIFSITEFLENFIQKRQEQYSNVRFKMDFQPAVREVRIEANKYQFEDAFHYLFLGFQNMTSEPIGLTISAHVSKAFSPKPRVRLEFVPEGKHNLAKTFEPFRLLTQSATSGSSLESAIVHTIFSNYGGTLRIDEDEQQTSTLVIEFPVYDRQPAPNTESRSTTTRSKKRNK